MRAAVSEILSDPIDWRRDPTRAEVPTEASMHRDISERWMRINEIVFDATPIEHDIQGVEEALLTHRNRINSGTLSQEFDWKHDFEMARFAHRFHYANLEFVRRKRTNLIDYWKDWATESTSFFRELSLNGQKTIYLLHGAIALGALNILVQSQRPRADVVLTAKLAVAFAVLGILLAGFGQVTMFYFSTQLIGRIRAKLLFDVKWTKIRAIARYIKKFAWTMQYGETAIYLSIIWFGVYVSILLIMLVST